MADKSDYLTMLWIGDQYYGPLLTKDVPEDRIARYADMFPHDIVTQVES